MLRHSEHAGLVRKERGIYSSSLPKRQGGIGFPRPKLAATSITVTHVLYQPKHRTLLKEVTWKEGKSENISIDFYYLLLNQVVQSLAGPGLLLTSLHIREVGWPKIALVLHQGRLPREAGGQVQVELLQTPVLLGFRMLGSVYTE